MMVGGERLLPKILG